MTTSRMAANKRRNRKDETDNPGVRFLYSEAVAKVLRKYAPCVEMVHKRYPSPYLYRDNTDLSLMHLPRLGEHYGEIPAPRIKPEVTKSFPDHLTSDRKRATTFFLPHINSRARLTTKKGVYAMGSRSGTAPMPPPGGYHRHCLERSDSNEDYTFMTERRSAYSSRRLPSAFGTPPPYTFSNRVIIEKMWSERIPRFGEY